MAVGKWLGFTSVGVSLLLSGCFHSEEHNHDHDTKVQLSGVVYAPGGGLAFKESDLLERALALVFGKSAIADLPGVAIVSGETVELVEVDAAGAVVGAVIASATTGANGEFVIDLPAGATIDGLKYVLRATGATETITARVTGTVVDVDPVSDHTNSVITGITAAKSSLVGMSLNEANIIKKEITGVVNSIDDANLSGLTSIASFTSTIGAAINANEETSNIVSSMQSDDAICGTVKDSSNAGLAEIKIVVRDFGNWVTRALSVTDSNGAYCVKVPAGDYIIGAVNNGTSSTAASEWYSTSGTAYSQIDAEKVTVPVSLTQVLTRDFTLEPGARISGTVLGSGGTLDGKGVQGVRMVARNFNTYFPFAFSAVNETGSYVMNVIPGDYVLLATNQTKHAYGSGVYAGANDNGVVIRENGKLISLTAGQIYTADFTLSAGYKIAGLISRNNTTPITGQRVRINSADGGASERIRTNKEGKYRIWLQPGVYDVDGYGQQQAGVDVSASSKNVSFISDVGVKSIKVVDHLGGAVSQAKVFVISAAGSFVYNDVTSSDGSGYLIADTTGDYKVRIVIDDERTYGSTVYNGKISMNSADLVSLTTGTDDTTDLIITLPEGNILSGTITDANSNPVANAKVAVQGTSFSVKTQSDGSYTISLPSGSYTGLNITPNGGVQASISTTIAISAVDSVVVDQQL